MKDKIWIFLMGFFVAISLAAIVDGDMLVIKPAKTKSTVIDYSFSISESQNFINRYQAQGYQVKTAIKESGIFIVMEKY